MSEEASFRSVARRTKNEIMIKKSRFIGDIAPAADEEEALALIEEVRAEYPTATHHCYAYVTAYPGRVVRMNDDGEPSGTAGRPILEVIEREDLTNTVIVVTRYFGGIMLGAGGLVRAYARSATEAIAAAGIVTYVLHERWQLNCDYASFGKVEYLLRSEDIAFSDPVFGTAVTLEISVPEARAEGLRETIDDLLGGASEWKSLGTLYLPG